MDAGVRALKKRGSTDFSMDQGSAMNRPGRLEAVDGEEEMVRTGRVNGSWRPRRLAKEGDEHGLAVQLGRSVTNRDFSIPQATVISTVKWRPFSKDRFLFA